MITETKTIKLIKDGITIEREMTVEEVLRQFEGMLKKFANDCVIKSKTMHNNVLGFEDFYGEGCIKLIESYNAYRPTFSFSTFLQNNLNIRRGELLRTMHTGKRKVKNSLMSFDVELEDGSFLKDVQGEVDGSFDEMIYNQDINKAMGTMTLEERKIMHYLVHQEISKTNLAEELDITRPTLDTRIKKTKEKLKDLLPEYLYFS